MEAVFWEIAQALIAGNVDEVEKLSREALDGGSSAQDTLNKGLLAGMDVVGQRFKNGEMFIPEVLRSAKAMNAGMEILQPFLVEGEAPSRGKVVIGTVEGDIHTIGKDLVAMLFEGGGFRVVNLGMDIPSQRFVDAVKEHKADILGMSAMITTTMPKMGETINALKEAGIRDQIKVMIGGAPVTEGFAEEIGADAYSEDAAIAVEQARGLLGKS